jgi:hypothetical protein
MSKYSSREQKEFDINKSFQSQTELLHIMADKDHVSPKCQNMGKTPQMLPSFEQNTVENLQRTVNHMLCLQML